MPSEMRRPGPIAIDAYVDLLDRQLRDEMVRIERRAWPSFVHRLTRALKTILQPLLQSGAVVLTSIAVIVAVGVAPATMRDPAPPETPLASPESVIVVETGAASLHDRLPPDEFLAIESFQSPDIRDTPYMEME
jgi:hypothetical protein